MGRKDDTKFWWEIFLESNHVQDQRDGGKISGQNFGRWDVRIRGGCN
jgi:hypothetical protein